MAVEQTKNKVRGDIMHYLQDKEKLLSFGEYEVQRRHYVEQIWVNVWVNLASNRVPRAEKKEYLSARGYEVEGVDRKIINKLFRTEIKGYKPFPVHEWLLETFSGETEQWEAMHEQAREDYLKQLQIKELHEMKKKCHSEMTEMIDDLIQNKRHFFYLQIRKMIADQLKNDMESKVKYQRVDPYAIEESLVSQGAFQQQDYFTVGDFLDELTGSIHKVLNWNRYEYLYETYYDVYETKIYETLSRVVPEKVKMLLPQEIVSRYDEEIFDDVLSEVCEENIEDLSEIFVEMVTDELFDNLINLTHIPFEEELHQ